MTDIEALRHRDQEFSVEEKLLCSVWVHDRNIHGKTIDDIQRDFEARFDKRAPKHDQLIMWERNAFSSGSVNFDDNYHAILASKPISAGGGSQRNSESPTNSFTDPQSPKYQLSAPPSSSSKYGQNSKSLSLSLAPGASSSSSANGHSYRSPSSSDRHHNHHHHHGGPYNSSHHNSSSSSSYQSKRSLRPSSTAMMGTSYGPGGGSGGGGYQPKNFNSALYKTELCRQYYESGRCDYAEKCLFAHGKHELKELPKYRKVCVSWAAGHCSYGPNCMFLHSNGTELRSSGGDRGTDSGGRRGSGQPPISMSSSSSSSSHRPSKMARNGHN